MNPKRKAYLEQQRLREEQIKRRAAEQSAAADPEAREPRKVEVIDRPVHDGLGGKFQSGEVVTETAENSAAIDAWLARGWARITT